MRVNYQISDWDYYKREVEAYQSGWLDALTGSLAAPRHYGGVEHPDGTCWIWLEDIHDEISQWPLEHYGVVAQHIGQFNNQWLAGQPSSLPKWMSTNWQREYINQSAPAMEPLRASLSNPLVKRWFPGNDSDFFFQVWSERHIYLDAMDRLPQTICHFDLFRRNLFTRRSEEGNLQSIAIDWSYVGRGPLGADICPLVLASIAFFDVSLDKAKELEEIVFEGYLQGLRDSGWQGERRQVRLGYLASTLRYLFAEIGRWLTYALDDRIHAELERAFGHPIGEIFDFLAVSRNLFIHNVVKEMRELMET